MVQITGKAKVLVEAGNEYVDAGATAIDGLDGNVEDLLDVNNPVNLQVPGEYIVTYVAVDRDGNEAEPVYRTVIVQDTTPPLLNLGRTDNRPRNW